MAKKIEELIEDVDSQIVNIGQKVWMCLSMNCMICMKMKN